MTYDWDRERNQPPEKLRKVNAPCRYYTLGWRAIADAYGMILLTPEQSMGENAIRDEEAREHSQDEHQQRLAVPSGAWCDQEAGTRFARKERRIPPAAWRRRGESGRGTVGAPMPRTANDLVSRAHPCPHFAHIFAVIAVICNDLQ